MTKNKYDFANIDEFLLTFEGFKTITDKHVQKLYELCQLYKSYPHLFKNAEIVLITQSVKQLKIDGVEGENVTIISDFLPAKLKKCGVIIYDKYCEVPREKILMPSHKEDDMEM